MADSISAIPANPYIKSIADFLRYLQEGDQAEAMPTKVSLFHWAAKLLFPQASTVENIAYGNYPMTMAPEGTGSKIPIVKTGRKGEVADIIGTATGGIPGAKIGSEVAATGVNKLSDLLVQEITRNPSATAMGVLDEAGQMVPLSRIFIGPKSQSWDAQAAKRAAELEKANVSPQKIYQETKTARMPSGDWVQEISDAPAKMTKKELVGEYYPEVGRYFESFKLPDVIEHPELFKAYPSLADVSGSFKTGGSSTERAVYSPGMNWISYQERLFRKPYLTPERQAQIDEARKAAKEFENRPDVKEYDKFFDDYMDSGKNDPKAFDEAFERFGGAKIERERSDLWKKVRELETKFETKEGRPRVVLDAPNANGTTLHEVSHAIEGIENWPRGGNPSEMGKFLDEEAFRRIEAAHDPLLVRFNELKAKYQNDPNPPKAIQTEVTNLKRRIKELQDQAKALTQMRQKFGTGKEYSEEEKFDAYQRLHGEAIARLVDRRAGLTAEQQAKFFPFERKTEANPYGLDYEPNELLIVRDDKLQDPLTKFLQAREPEAYDPFLRFIGSK